MEAPGDIFQRREPGAALRVLPPPVVPWTRLFRVPRLLLTVGRRVGGTV